MLPREAELYFAAEWVDGKTGIKPVEIFLAEAFVMLLG